MKWWDYLGLKPVCGEWIPTYEKKWIRTGQETIAYIESNLSEFGSLVANVADKTNLSALIPGTYFKVKIYAVKKHHGFKRHCCDRKDGKIDWYWENKFFPGIETGWEEGEVLEVYNDLTSPEPPPKTETI